MYTYVHEYLESLEKGEFVVCSVFQLIVGDKGDNPGVPHATTAMVDIHSNLILPEWEMDR